MRVVVNQGHIILCKKLAKESNTLVQKFNNKSYSKVEDIGNILLKRDISVESKKRLLIKKLHDSAVRAFSIDKKKFNKKSLESLKKRLHNLRKLIIKLRSINYYLETTFLEELKYLKIKSGNYSPGIRRQNALARDELEALEYTAYKLIGEVVMLDKRLLGEYKKKGKRILRREKIEVKDLKSMLGKNSELLEHLEAKFPPPKAVSKALIKEPVFTHWVARIFALLAHIEDISAKEMDAFNQLRKNKAVRAKINRKIIHIMKEKSKLLRIMQEKSSAMEKFRIGGNVKEELHNLATAINI